jgi:hypothetical protein
MGASIVATLTSVQSTARLKLEVLCHVVASCPLAILGLTTDPIYRIYCRMLLVALPTNNKSKNRRMKYYIFPTPTA